MEFILVVVMIVAGFAAAVVVMLALAAAEHREEGSPGAAAVSAGREEVEATLLVGIGIAGGLSYDDSLARARELVGTTAAPRVRGDQIDVATWADALRKRVDVSGRERLLDAAVRLAVATNPTIPVRQYSALLDLSFGLGFQTDALARLRARYRFEYVDHAKRSRPAEADRRGHAAEGRRGIDRGALAGLFGLGEQFSRRDLVTAYRRLAAREHPDRFHGVPEAEREAASSRFIALTEAYEALLPWARED